MTGQTSTSTRISGVVFSTGTLTENDMQFRQCSIGATRYVDADGELCLRPKATRCRADSQPPSLSKRSMYANAIIST